MFMKEIDIYTLKDEFKLELLAGERGLHNKIASEDLHRPGLELTGFYRFFPHERIQVIGKQEMSYFHSLFPSMQKRRLNEYFRLAPPCVIVTRAQTEIPYFQEYAEKYQVPLLRTTDKTTNFISEVNNFLEKKLAVEQGIHAVCVNVFGVGIIIRGQSGVGKSELALSLIERGHRLISDDLVILKRIGPVALIGSHNGTNKEFLSLRGIGIINILRLYGSGSLQNETKINLDIELVPWVEGTYYDAIGREENQKNYLGIDVPTIQIPIRPGRDVASLVEVAAKNWRLKQEGYHAFKDFENRLHDQTNE